MKKTLLLIIATIAINTCFAAADSTITPSSGIAAITPTSDTTADTLWLSSFVGIEDVSVMDVGIASLLTVAMEEGDFATYVVVRYNLLDATGKVLYSNRYRIYGSCYNYLATHDVGYVFWKICNEKNFTPE